VFSAFKSACGYFILHTYIREHSLRNTFSTHLTVCCFLWVDHRKHCSAGFCFVFLLSLNSVWSLSYLLFTINFTFSYVTFYYWSRITAWICVTSTQRHKYCYIFWSLDLLQGPHRCSAFTSIVLRCVLVFYFADIHVNIYIFLHMHAVLFFFDVRLFDITGEWSSEDNTVTVPKCWR